MTRSEDMIDGAYRNLAAAVVDRAMLDAIGRKMLLGSRANAEWLGLYAWPYESLELCGYPYTRRGLMRDGRQWLENSPWCGELLRHLNIDASGHELLGMLTRREIVYDARTKSLRNAKDMGT